MSSMCIVQKGETILLVGPKPEMENIVYSDSRMKKDF